MSSRKFFGLFMAVVLTIMLPRAAFAHRSGCHTLHTCPSDSDTYVCGDLGYPCNGVTSINDISLAEINVPLLVEVIFMEEFGRKPSDIESAYWKTRFRDDKGSVYKLRRVMAWHKANGSFGPPLEVVPASTVAVSRINALFRQAYEGRNPTMSENQYWITRIADKHSERALVDAMRYHYENDIRH